MISYSNWQYPQRAKGWVVNFWGLHTKSVGNKRFEFDFRFHILVCLSKFSMPYDQSPFHVWGLPSVLASPISWGQQGSLETPGLLDSIWIQTGPLWDISHVMGMRPVGSLTPRLFFTTATCLCVVQPTHLVVYPWPCSKRPLITLALLGFLHLNRETQNRPHAETPFSIESYHLCKHFMFCLARRKKRCYIRLPNLAVEWS